MPSESLGDQCRVHLELRKFTGFKDLPSGPGSILCAWATNSILLPHQFLSGGVTGLVLIIHYLMPQFSLA